MVGWIDLAPFWKISYNGGQSTNLYFWIHQLYVLHTATCKGDWQLLHMCHLRGTTQTKHLLSNTNYVEICRAQWCSNPTYKSGANQGCIMFMNLYVLFLSWYARYLSLNPYVLTF